ncbi:MAG: hypothetical protein QXR65_07340 [Candidatus Bathyarchaeia archaeon]|nr:hypothetical protein [Candidatus Bathyarchaeota archaeon]
MRRLLPLGLLLVSVWGLMLLASYAASMLLADPPWIPRLSGGILGIYRVAMGSAIFLVWLWIWKRAAEKYFEAFSRRRRLR